MRAELSSSPPKVTSAPRDNALAIATRSPPGFRCSLGNDGAIVIVVDQKRSIRTGRIACRILAGGVGLAENLMGSAKLKFYICFSVRGP